MSGRITKTKKKKERKKEGRKIMEIKRVEG